MRILSFEGGGVRGALSIHILARLIKRYPELLTKTELYTGSSTGSYIALCLANNLPITTLKNLYSIKTAKYIFSSPRLNLLTPKYSNKHLVNILNKTFTPSLTLADLPNLVFIPAFNVHGYSKSHSNAVFLNNIIPNTTSHETVVNTALYSSAFPAVFPSKNGFIDGTVINNFPSISPILFLRSVYPHKYHISDFRVLAIGTGLYPTTLKSNITNWGSIQWGLNPNKYMISPLIDILLSAPLAVNDEYSKELLGNNYFKINPQLETLVKIDSYKKIPLLIEVAKNLDLSTTYRYIETYYLK
ncbi:MAG: hypothetical protein BEN19_00270 [Epulopiscium sp. Nuni2H_MBin003]|nr:MAG: hypothetical protein BEN19_00270 [Epulopiscium sp. Nuni2H_MBin003]